ncbi:hypothetical protein HMPREF9374_2280 [Desmospora sp. 8437]|nr:hypothetical protein HMPREF9374_2280 [Desmospora sp. 8437]
MKAVGIGFHIPFRCSYEPKSLHVKPNPPCIAWPGSEATLGTTCCALWV